MRTRRVAQPGDPRGRRDDRERVAAASATRSRRTRCTPPAATCCAGRATCGPTRRSHPAYARIIGELAPDEGRILLLLLRKGPQATVDVRTGGLVGTVSSNLVQANLNMIGPLAGCRYVDRVPSYLHNLERLGLIWFSRETLRDPMEYQVLEAQPDVTEARHSVRRAKVVRRSIHLTPFGEDFCRDGLGLHLSDEELDAAPPHAKPECTAQWLGRSGTAVGSRPPLDRSCRGPSAPLLGALAHLLAVEAGGLVRRGGGAAVRRGQPPGAGRLLLGGVVADRLVEHRRHRARAGPGSSPRRWRPAG